MLSNNYQVVAKISCQNHSDMKVMCNYFFKVCRCTPMTFIHAFSQFTTVTLLGVELVG